MMWNWKRCGRFAVLSTVCAALVVPLAAPASAAIPPAPNLKSGTGGPTAGQITIKWGSPPVSAAVTSFRGSVSVNGTTWSTPTTIGTSNATSASLACGATRTPNSGCWFRVYSVNASGVSAPSNLVFGKWAAPSKPQNVRANAGPLAGKATISFAAPANNGGASVSSYRYEYSLDNVAWTVGGSDPGAGGSVNANWCGTGQPFCYFRLRAVNSIGVSLPSASWLANFDVPAVVQTITSSAAPISLATGSSLVTITWGAPDTNGVQIDKYEAQYCAGWGACEDVDPFWNTASTTALGNVLTTSMTCPVDATTCAYRIRAHNSLGWGDWRHQFLQPYQPTNFDVFTGSLPGAVDLQWGAPIDGGTGNLQYQVFRCKSSCSAHASWQDLTLGGFGIVVPGNALSATDPGCGFGSTCTYRIAVKDSWGNQSLLTTTKTATGSLFAGPPKNLTAATAASVAGRVDLAWTAADAPPGLPVTGYTITRVIGSGAATFVATVGGSVFSYADTTCGATVICLYFVYGENATGTGAPAAAVAIGAGAPLAPQNVVAVPGTVLGGVSLSWTPPANDGGHVVTGYTVSRISPNAAVVANTAALTIQDPTCGAATSCQYRVAAINSIGTGVQSATAVATGTNVPSAPTLQPAAASTTKGAVRLNWTPPSSDGGRAILGYVVERFNAGTSSYVGIDSTTAATLTYNDITCGVGNLCNYQVRAINVAGIGAASSSSGATGSIQSQIVYSSSTAINVQGVQLPLAGDFTGDGKSDILWYVPGSGTDTLFVSIGNGNFVGGPAVNISGTYTPIVGDFNGDGGDDVLWYAPGTKSDSLWLSNLNGTFRSGPKPNINGIYKPLVGKFDNDDASDILWYAPGSAPESLWLSDGDGSFHGGKKPNVNSSYVPAIGDFDGNGHSDILWYAPGSNPESLWLANGDSLGGFHNGPKPNINGSYTLIPGDFDGDAITDVFFYAPGSATESMWLGGSAGTFTTTSAASVSSSYLPASGDFDGNGKSDIEWFSPTGTDRLWLFL